MNEELDPGVEYADDHRDECGLPEIDVEEVEIVSPVATDDEERRDPQQVEGEDRETAEEDT